MTLTNAPPDVEAMADMLGGCASWSGGTTTIWYPTAPENTSGTFALIFPIDTRRTRYAEGLRGIPSGSIQIVIFADDDVGDLETLARSLVDELFLQQTGLLLRGASIAPCSDPGPAKVAGGEARRDIAITIDYGLAA